MSETVFEKALDSLRKPQNSERLQKVLVAVRKEIEWPKDRENVRKLRVKGCLKYIVESLQIRNGNLIGVSLSILGNCCMERDSARDLVLQCSILPELLVLLNNFTKHDSVNGRVFRIIGNICQHWDRFSDTIVEKVPQIVDMIVSNLKLSVDDEENSDITEATVNMGIRALRELLNCNTVQPLVKNHQVLNALGMLLIYYTNKYTKNVKNEGILNNIVRTLHEYSRYKYSDSLMQLKSTDNGNSLICLCELIPLSPKRIVKMLMNFIKVSFHKSDLPTPEICESLMKYLKDTDVNTDEALFKEYLQCFCLLFDHPSNREVIKNKEGVPLLIDILKQFKAVTEFALKCCSLILSSLLKCLYDDSLVAVQIKCGIIEALIEKLEWVVGPSTCLDIKHDLKKRKYDATFLSDKSDCCGDGCNSDDALHLQCVSNKRSSSPSAFDGQMCYSPMTPGSPRRCSSPSDSLFPDTLREIRSASPSSSSELSFSDGASPNLSWSGTLTSAGDNSDWDSDDYSPVCSEIDEEDDYNMVPSDFVLNDDHVEELVSDKEDNANEGANYAQNSMNVLKLALCEDALRILRWLSKVTPVIQELGCPRLLIVLIRCSKDYNSQTTLQTVGIIMNILESQDHLLPLMQTDFIPMVYDLTLKVHGNLCERCKQLDRIGQQILARLCNLAESGGGRGDIAHHLIRGNISVKRKLVLVLPYIIRNKSILSKLMLNCGGLLILMDLLTEKNDLRQSTIKVLCAMAFRKLGIKSPVHLRRRCAKVCIDLEPYQVNANCLNVVTFKLDDGSFIKADRDFLSEKSDYFNKLLSGEFKESQEDVIVLRNVANKSLKSLFSLLYRDISRTEVLEVNLDLLTLLDLIMLTDRYLLVDLCVSLTGCVEQFKISTKTAHTIYQWALESGTNILRVETIAFALGAKVLDSERFVMFENFFDLGYSEQIVEDIQKLLKRFLTVRFRHVD